MLPAPGFHHLHLNSVDPDAAIDFYTRQFPTTAKTSWGGLPALAVAEQRPDPVHQGGHRARHVAADRDLALRLACPRHARDASTSYKGRPDVTLLPLYTTDERRLGLHQQRHLAGHGRRASA